VEKLGQKLREEMQQREVGMEAELRFFDKGLAQMQQVIAQLQES
jgi:hypothetical protein